MYNKRYQYSCRTSLNSLTLEKAEKIDKLVKKRWSWFFDPAVETTIEAATGSSKLCLSFEDEADFVHVTLGVDLTDN